MSEAVIEVSWLGPLAAFLSSVTWAFGTTVYSGLSREYSAYTVNFTRALVALPLFVGAAVITSGASGAIDQYAHLPFKNISWFGLSMLCSYGIGDILFLSSARCMGVPSALAVSSISPLWAVLVSAFFRREFPSLLQSSGVVVTLAGVTGVIIAGSRDLRLTQRASIEQASKWKGPVLAVLTSIFWGMNMVAVAQGGTGVSPLIGNSVRMVFALVITSLMWKKFAPPQCSVILPLAVLKKNLLLFACEAFGGSLFFMYGLAHSTVVLGATLASLSPAVAVPISWLLRTEKPNLLKSAAVLATVFGVWLLFV